MPHKQSAHRLSIPVGLWRLSTPRYWRGCSLRPLHGGRKRSSPISLHSRTAPRTSRWTHRGRFHLRKYLLALDILRDNHSRRPHPAGRSIFPTRDIRACNIALAKGEAHQRDWKPGSLHKVRRCKQDSQSHSEDGHSAAIPDAFYTAHHTGPGFVYDVPLRAHVPCPVNLSSALEVVWIQHRYWRASLHRPRTWIPSRVADLRAFAG